MTDLVIRLCAWERVFPCDEGKPEGSLYLEAAARIEELETELHLMKTSGRAEVAVRNPSVMEYMRHWEGRAEAAEAKLAAVIAAYRLEAMKRDDYSHDAFDKHSAELTGGKDE